MVYKVWEPSECVCGFRAKGASIAMGVLGTLGSILHVSHMLVYTTATYDGIIDFCDTFDEVRDLDACAKGTIAALIITGITAFMTGIASVVLLWGVKKKNANMVFFYLGVKTFCLCLYGPFYLGVVLYVFTTKYAFSNFIFIVIGGLSFYLEIFFFLCVRVYWRKLKYPEEYVNNDPFYKKPLPPPPELMKFAKMPPQPE